MVANLFKNMEQSDSDNIKYRVEIDLLKAGNVSEVIVVLKQHLVSLIKQYYSEDDGGNNYIRQAVRYIEDHYAQPVKLEDVAGYVHLNVTYFSEMFKAERGITFSEFLANVRLEHAKNFCATRIMESPRLRLRLVMQMRNTFPKYLTSLLELNLPVTENSTDKKRDG